jgi:hypothetical protein
MSNAIKHFLLVFDHEKGALVQIVEFGSDSERAVAAYAEKEKECEQNPAMEIVLIGSDSFETVQFTHANYFDGSAAAARSKSPYLAGV